MVWKCKKIGYFCLIEADTYQVYLSKKWADIPDKIRVIYKLWARAKTTKFMLKKIILILLTSFALTLFGQTSNKGNFLCQSDSVSYSTVKSLTDNGIKAIMTFYYGYYDGRTSDDLHYIVWLDNFNGHLKKITGCDNPKIKDTILNKSIRDIFDFYNSNQIDTITRDIESRVSMYYEKGYYIKVYLPNKTKVYKIGNFERGVTVFEDGKRTDGKENFNLKDPRIIWLKLFETTVRNVVD